MPGLPGQSWRDSSENYVNSYSINIKGSTATAAHLSEDVTIPCALYSVSLYLNPSVGSGEVSLRDGRGTGTAGNTRWSATVASAASQVYAISEMFTRGVVFASGIVVSAVTVTGNVNLTFKQRPDT